MMFEIDKQIEELLRKKALITEWLQVKEKITAPPEILQKLGAFIDAEIAAIDNPPPAAPKPAPVPEPSEGATVSAGQPLDPLKLVVAYKHLMQKEVAFPGLNGTTLIGTVLGFQADKLKVKLEEENVILLVPPEKATPI